MKVTVAAYKKALNAEITKLDQDSAYNGVDWQKLLQEAELNVSTEPVGDSVEDYKAERRRARAKNALEK